MKKIPVWLPYTSKITCKKDAVVFEYKGGQCEIDIKNTASILFYGAVCDIPEDFLALCTKRKVPVCVHRRNMPNASWIIPTSGVGTDDIISKQIRVRQNAKKCAHIARKLLKAKFVGMNWLAPEPFDFSAKLKTPEEMRSIEARHGRLYWDKYYAALGLNGYSRRGSPHTLKSVLDAVSKLIAGILLRYIIYHRISPYHAFLHTPTDYPSLIYDLMEPYRGYIEKVVFDAFRKREEEECDDKKMLGICISLVEDLLDTQVYCSATRQLVTFQELLHGNILALRAYLLGESKQFIVPMPGKPNGGRPLKTGYRLYGRSAGPTDFWTVAGRAHTAQERRMRNEKALCENKKVSTATLSSSLLG